MKRSLWAIEKKAAVEARGMNHSECLHLYLVLLAARETRQEEQLELAVAVHWPMFRVHAFQFKSTDTTYILSH